MKRLIFLLLGTLVMTACGGGGGGGSSASPVSAASGTADGSGGTSASSGASGGAQTSGSGFDLIRGRITGFGSVYIDGKRFDTSGASISKDDQAAQERDLSVGMVVELRGDLANGTATRVDFEEDIKGPIDAIAPGSDQLTVMGQTVVVTGNTTFDDGLTINSLIVGDILEVSGLRGANDVLEASFLERKTASETEVFKVIGAIRNLDSTARSFDLGGLRVSYGAAELDDGVVIANDNLVEVKDSAKAYSPGDFALMATKIEPAGLGTGAIWDSGGGSDGSNNQPNRVQIEGLISQLNSDGEFLLAGTIVRHNSSTQFVYGEDTQLTVGTKVKVEGSLESNGVLAASKIKFSKNSARLHGQVEVVDQVGLTLSILGVTADLSQVREYEDDRDDLPTFSASDIRAGDFLEIRGNTSGNVVVAGEVERDEDDDSRLRGPASNVDTSSRTFSILGVPIVVSANTQYEGFNDEVLTAEAFFSALSDGQTLVSAKWDGTVTDTTVPVKEVSLED